MKKPGKLYSVIALSYKHSMKLALDVLGFIDAKDARNPVEAFNALGIKYSRAEPQPIADQWMFYGVVVDTVPRKLPDFIRIIFEASDRARHKDFGPGYVREVKGDRVRFMPDLAHPITVLHNGEWLDASSLTH